MNLQKLLCRSSDGSSRERCFQTSLSTGAGPAPSVLAPNVFHKLNFRISRFFKVGSKAGRHSLYEAVGFKQVASFFAESRT